MPALTFGAPEPYWKSAVRRAAFKIAKDQGLSFGSALAKKAYNRFKAYYSTPIGPTMPTARRSSRRSYKGSYKRRSYIKKRRFKRRRRVSFKKARFKRRRKSTLSKRVRTLSRQVNSDVGTKVNRTTQFGVLGCAINSSVFATLYTFTDDAIEAELAVLKYYDPSTPGTLITTNGAVGTYQKSYNFTNIDTKVSVTNNYQIPVKVVLYCFVPKDDTSIAPTTAFVDGIAKKGVTDTTALNIYPSDSDLLNQLWSFHKTKKFTLAPGRTVVQSLHLKDILFDPSMKDSHSDAFQKRWGAHAWCIRIEGVTAHDGVNIGTAQGSVDYRVDIKTRIKYDAGVDVDQIGLTETVGTMTTPLVSQRPVADNQFYASN